MRETLTLIAADNYAAVTAATFGHLAPKPNNEHKGWILFTLTAFGDTCIIDFEFDNLSESPWFNNDVLDCISDYTSSLPEEKNFGIFRWNGSYKKFKNGNFRFKGKFAEITCL